MCYLLSLCRVYCQCDNDRGVQCVCTIINQLDTKSYAITPALTLAIVLK